MSDAPSLLNIAHPSHPVNRTLSVIKLLVLAVSVAAAIPTARNLYFSWKNDVPFNQVDHRLICFPVISREARNDVAEVVLFEFGICPDRAGEKPLAQRAEGNESDPKLLECGDDLRLGLSPPK